MELWMVVELGSGVRFLPLLSLFLPLPQSLALFRCHWTFWTSRASGLLLPDLAHLADLAHLEIEIEVLSGVHRVR